MAAAVESRVACKRKILGSAPLHIYCVSDCWIKEEKDILVGGCGDGYFRVTAYWTGGLPLTYLFVFPLHFTLT